MYIALALIGHLLNALVVISDKAFVQNLYPHPKVLTFFASVGGLVFFFLFPWFLKPASLYIVVAAIFSGILVIPSLLLFFNAMQKEEVSRVVPVIGTFTALFTFGLSFLILGERLSGHVLFAFVFLIVGGALIEVHSLKKIFLHKLYSLFLLEVAAGFLFALGFVLLKFAFEGGDNISAFLWARFGSAGAALFLLFDQDIRQRLTFQKLKSIGSAKVELYVASRVLAGVAPLIILLAISLGSVTIVNALQGVQFVILFFLALLFSRSWPSIFREEFRLSVILQKITATVFIGIGIGLLTL